MAWYTSAISSLPVAIAAAYAKCGLRFGEFTSRMVGPAQFAHGSHLLVSPAERRSELRGLVEILPSTRIAEVPPGETDGVTGIDNSLKIPFLNEDRVRLLEQRQRRCGSAVPELGSAEQRPSEGFVALGKGASAV